MRVPLAWRNLVHRPRRLAAAISGISFAVVLMFMQTGFRNALLDSTVKIIDELDADLLIVSRGLYALPAQQRFDRQRILQARGCPGVASVHPIYIESFYGKLQPRNRKGHPIRVLAFDIDETVLRPKAVVHGMRRLREPGTALIDVRSKAKFGFAALSSGQSDPGQFELADRSIQLVGAFSLGTDFANDGNLIMSRENFAEYFPNRAGAADPLSVVDLGVVKLARGADLHQVRRRLAELLPEDVAVVARSDFARREKSFWDNNTPIGYIFFVGTVMGFLVGVIICYQIIYTSVSDHVPEFATLKAMGYRRRYFVHVVMCESFYLSLLGFVPGLVISLAVYAGLADQTGLMMSLNAGRVAQVYGMTVVMCMVSGVLAMRKVMSADPATLF